mgnify:CR=1 FL=1
MKQLLTKPIGRIVLAALAVLALIAYIGVCVVETVQIDGWSDQYVKTYRKATLWCYGTYHVFPHVSCERYCIRIGSEEWDNPAGRFVPYWRDPADGAIVFCTNEPGTGVYDVYMVMPSGGPQFHDRFNSSHLIRFSGGDLGATDPDVIVTRLGKQKFELKSRDNPLESMVIDLPLYKK